MSYYERKNNDQSELAEVAVAVTRLLDYEIGGSNPGVNLIKLFWPKFTRTFLNKITNICFIAMKINSLQVRVSKFTPKTFYEIDPRPYRNLLYKFSNFFYSLPGLDLLVILFLSSHSSTEPRRFPDLTGVKNV